MNQNMSGNQWRPLQPQQNEFSSGSGGSIFHQQPQQRPPRSITKNPQNMAVGFQNFAPNGFGANSFGLNSGNGNSNNGPLSPPIPNSASTGRLTSLMSPNGGGGHSNMGNFDFLGGGRTSDQTRVSPSFNTPSGLQQIRGGNNLMNMPNPLSPREFERHSMNNGYDNVRTPSSGQSSNSGMSNGFRGGQSENLLRSMSMNNGAGPNTGSQASSFFEQFKSSNTSTSNNQPEINSLLRHMSVPNGVPENGSAAMSRNGGVNGQGITPQTGFMRSPTAMPNMKSPTGNGGFGILNSGNSRNDIFSNNGGSMFNSRQDNDGIMMRNSSPPSNNSTYNGGVPKNEMAIGMWNEPRPSSPSKNDMRMNSNGFMNGMGDGNNSAGNNSSFSSMNTPDFEIGTFIAPTAQGGSNESGSSKFQIGNFGNPENTGSQYGSGGRSIFGQSQSGRPVAGPGIRETGIIEKLLHSYGFIQCCDRQARLFFHFSQFDGTIEHLKIGDPVEFEMTYDRRTGKPIASVVSKIAPEVVMSEERVIGIVTTEARIDADNGQETQGRISYENRGECFFLPFTLSDVEGNVTVAAGDKCSFQMATMARTGNLVARTIRLENPVAPVKYQGVVNSVKDQKTFGFIERSDVVREIFFHFTEVEEGENIDLGDDVEFTIQTRSGKEVATNIVALPPGTVVFEDVGSEYYTGQVLKPLDRSFKAPSLGLEGKGPEEALNGRVKYRGVDRSEVEVPFGEKDQVGDFTMRHGDWIKFVIAVDRRDKLRRATKIELLDESFQVSDERREQGTVHTIRDGFGFMRCAERDVRMFFHFSECLDVKRTVSIGDDCEFTVSPDPNQPTRMLATRIKHLPSGTVQFDIIIHKDITGRVDTQPAATSWAPRSPSRNMNSTATNIQGSSSPDKFDSENSNKEGAGKIMYELNGSTFEIPLYASDCDLRNFPRKEDVVQFDINQSKATKETNAINIVIIESPAAKLEAVEKAAAEAAAAKEMQAKRDLLQRERDQRRPATFQGYIAALKDGFGFVETLTHEKEIFFHFSNVEGKTEKLEVGMEVEYTIFNREKGGKISAEGVKVLTKGSIPPLKASEEVLNGKVMRPLRSANPDQEDYCGLIHVKSEEGKVLAQYEFGIASLLNKKELLQIGDPVQFQVHITEDFAVNIQATREKLRSNVEAMKGQFGFLSYEVDEGKKLFFHTSEVESGEILQQGDEVEFVVVTNKRTGKHSACCVRKLSSSKRPERLISKLKTMNLEDAARGGKKIVVIRQPRGPEGMGFKATRNV